VKTAGRKIIVVGALAAAFMLLGAPAAQAYVDPGTGSFIFQAVIGGALAAAVALKVFWKRITDVFSRKGEAPTPDE
jgi:hypothetical protein